MRRLLTTTAMLAALSMPVYAGESSGTEATGEADGSVRLSAQDPSIFLGGTSLAQGTLGESAMAQGTLPRRSAKARTSSSSSEKADDSMHR